MTAPVDVLLDRLDGVRARGPGQWIARCPAHDDRSPSLSIRATDDGMLLVHDHAGCATDAVLGAIGLEYSDLYPEPLPADTYSGRQRVTRPRLSGWAVVDAIAYRLSCIAVFAEQLRAGEPVSADDWRTLDEAIADVQTTIREARHAR